MRLTNEEILTQFPSWSNRLSVKDGIHPSKNIQQVRYGDILDYQYTQESYNHYQQENSMRKIHSTISWIKHLNCRKT